jgi:pyridoxine/pyridoxamine 5'-phosphate oxidase
MTLEEFFSQAKSELIRANKDRRHPFRTLVLATKAEYPGVRTVVKRRTLDDLSTLIYTDQRTPKVGEIKLNDQASLLWYHDKKKFQVIINAKIQILTEGELFEKHREIALRNAKDYSTRSAPGSALSESDYRYGANEHFCLLHCHPISIQLLQLGKERHWRAVFHQKGNWKGQWLVP